MKFHYDKQVDAFSLRFNDGEYAESDEVKEGVIFDYDRDGKIMGIEILNASRSFAAPFARDIAEDRLSAHLAIDPA